MSVTGRSWEADLGLATGFTDAWWSVPLGIYRLSRRRLAASPQLYRAGVLRHQRERDRLPGMTTIDVAAAQARLGAEEAGGRLNAFHAQAVRGAIDRARTAAGRDGRR